MKVLEFSSVYFQPFETCPLYYDLVDNSDERAGGVWSEIGRGKDQRSGQGKVETFDWGLTSQPR